MTSIPLPSGKYNARARKEVRFEDEPPLNKQNMSRLSNMFSSIWRYGTKDKKLKPGKSQPLVEKEQKEDDDEDEVSTSYEASTETESEKTDDAKEDQAFPRSAFRQSVKRAIGWRKSQKKAVNKRKKENIQNSKLLTGRDLTDEDDYYDDDELDAVIVSSTTPQISDLGTTKQAKSQPEAFVTSKIPKRRQSTKRPAMSIKSAGFLSQTVTSKKAQEAEKSGVLTTTPARNNKASALREQAARRKLEETGTPLTITIKEPPRKAKPRASFRMKKGISRKPVHAIKKEPIIIKPAENKASRLRAQKIHEIEPEKVEKPRSRSGSHIKSDRKEDEIAVSNTPPERFNSTAIKTPALKTITNTNSMDNTPPPKPQRTKLYTTPQNSPSSSSKKNPTDDPKVDTPERTPSSENTIIDLDMSPKFSRRYNGRSQKFSPTSIVHSGSSFNFIPIQTESEPSEDIKRNQIDEIKRKRKITRPTSNIFDSFDNDYVPPSNKRIFDDKSKIRNSKSLEKLTAKENYPVIQTEAVVTPCKRSDRTVQSKTPLKQKNPCPPKTPPTKTSPLNITKPTSLPKPIKSAPARSKHNMLSARLGSSIPSEESEPECFGSSLEDTPTRMSYNTEKEVFEDKRASESAPMLDLSIISREDLTRIMTQLKSPRSRKGSVRAMRKVRSSWCISDSTFLDDKFSPPPEKCKTQSKNIKPTLETLDNEELLLEDLSSGHHDVCDALTSRTKAIRNVLAQWRLADYEKSAKMTVCLSFPSHYPVEEFRTMRRICERKTDDYALFQNCLGIMIADRENVSLSVLSIVIPMVRLTFEVLGSEVLRGSVGNTLKLLASQHGQSIMYTKAGYNANLSGRITECSEICADELQKIKSFVNQMVKVDKTPELMALQKSLELFGIR